MIFQIFASAGLISKAVKNPPKCIKEIPANNELSFASRGNRQRLSGLQCGRERGHKAWLHDSALSRNTHLRPADQCSLCEEAADFDDHTGSVNESHSNVVRPGGFPELSVETFGSIHRRTFQAGHARGCELFPVDS